MNGWMERKKEKKTQSKKQKPTSNIKSQQQQVWWQANVLFIFHNMFVFVCVRRAQASIYFFLLLPYFFVSFLS